MIPTIQSEFQKMISSLEDVMSGEFIPEEDKMLMHVGFYEGVRACLRLQYMVHQLPKDEQEEALKKIMEEVRM